MAVFTKKYGYDLKEQEVKYLECYLNRKINLLEDQAIRSLFLPVYDNEEDQDEKFQSHKPRPYCKTKPDFLKCRVPNGTQIIRKENDIDEI